MRPRRAGSYDQFPLARAMLGAFAGFLKEDMRPGVDFLGEQPAGVRVNVETGRYVERVKEKKG